MRNESVRGYDRKIEFLASEPSPERKWLPIIGHSMSCTDLAQISL